MHLNVELQVYRRNLVDRNILGGRLNLYSEGSTSVREDTGGWKGGAYAEMSSAEVGVTWLNITRNAVFPVYIQVKFRRQLQPYNIAEGQETLWAGKRDWKLIPRSSH